MAVVVLTTRLHVDNAICLSKLRSQWIAPTKTLTAIIVLQQSCDGWFVWL
jgi:hypothetical protein